MATLPEILQASELAISQNGEYPWPGGSVDNMPGNGTGVLLDGHSFTYWGIKRVKPSVAYPERAVTYSGFKIGGTPLTLAQVGTQPHSLSANLLTQLGEGTHNLYRENGCLYVGTIPLGNPFSASYRTTIKRDIKIITIHCCAAGGGGGGGAAFWRGWAGGSGAILVSVIDVTDFTSTYPLVITIGSGGSGGVYYGGNGQNGTDLVISSTHPSHNGTITVHAGTGGKCGGSSNGQGLGGSRITITEGSTLQNIFEVLVDGAGTDGDTGTPPIGGQPQTWMYTDPNPALTQIYTSQSINPINIGSGGDGSPSAVADGYSGKPGALFIYY